jgi:solute:Na+ symporter, SSS family
MIFFIALYLLIQLAICYWVARKVNTSSDFFLAGRSLPTPVVAMSLVASWFGAETCIGSSGAVYDGGLSASRADPFGYSMCLLLMGLLIAAPLWRGGYITLSDFYAERYGPWVEKLTAFVLIPGSLIWGAAQIRAFGQVVSSTTQLPVETTIFFCTFAVVVYTLLGGLLGDIITDMLKGALIFFGLLSLFFYVINSADFSWSLFSTMPKERLSFLASEETVWQRLDRWAIPILGSLVAQELISRTLAAKSPQVAKRGSYWACFIYLFLGVIPLFLGLIGPQIFPNVSHNEQFLTGIAQHYLPPVIYVIFVGALISAILSTIDTILLSMAAITVQNVMDPWIQHKSEKYKLRVVRVMIVFFALLAYAIAHFSSGIYSLLEAASSFGTSGLLIITFFGIYSRWGNALAGSMALISGMIFYQVGDSWLAWDAPFLMAILAAFIAYVLGALIEQKWNLPSLKPASP